MKHNEPIELGRRIAVFGVTGSGKTTIACQLGQALGLPAIELDSLFWQPNWVETPPEEFRAKVGAALDAAPDGWVCDGNYRTRLKDLVLARADTVVWMHLPFRVTFWRVFRRTISRAWSQEALWGTNYESWRLTFFDRKSLLLWSITHHKATARSTVAALAEMEPRPRVYELRSAREVNVFLAGVREEAVSPPGVS
jgi:adenylate kinase family enzyme